jgi:hypothetical protein
MGPATILSKLADLRRRELLLRFVWGAARVAAVALVLLALCCLADWLVDRWRDTPLALRALFIFAQLGTAVALIVLLVLLPVYRPLRDSTLAKWVEREFPAFRHRLITAVELNRPGADTKGMSPVLIKAVTDEAERKAAATDFAPALDSRRLKWSAFVLFPVLIVLLLPAIVAPRTVFQLLGRQLLLPIDITRSVRFELDDVESVPPENLVGRDAPRLPHHDIREPSVCASGDEVAIRFKAEGRVNQDTRGTLRIWPDGGAPEDVSIEWEKEAPDGKAIFVAKVPASSVDFQYQAWLGDARIRERGRVEFVTRPTVEGLKAVVELPVYCGLRTDGTRFEEPQAKADILAMSGSSAIVTLKASKPLTRAEVQLLGPSQPGAPEETLRQPEPTVTLDADKLGATARFSLEPRQTAYRVLVWDEHGFVNRVAPRRAVATLPDEPPVVTLLPEDSETEGAPIIKGKRLRVAYQANSPATLSEARFRYRIVRDQGESAKDFEMLPLTEYNGSPEVGEFDLNRGLFEKIRDDDYQARVEFHAIPAPPDRRDIVPSRRQGGGRLIFETANIPDMKIGDRLEYYVEVLDARTPGLVGRSEARVKEIVNAEQFGAWVSQKLREDDKLRDLANRQGGLFDRPGPAPEK